ncbi:TPA: serine O-acetyltransferase [Bacillus cereus]
MLKKLRYTWSRHSGPRGLIIMSIYRFGNTIHYRVKVPLLRQILLLLYRILDTIFVRMFLNAEFPAQAKIGKNIILPHGGNGVIISINSEIGSNVVIFHQVTLGTINPGDKVVICDNAFIGAGAKVLGDIVVGQHSKIGANAVVLQDVPEQTTAVGIPAQIIAPKEIRRAN